MEFLYPSSYRDVTIGDCRDPAGPQEKCGAREIRIQHHDVQSLTGPQMDLRYAPIDNFACVQGIRDLDSELGVSSHSDGHW